MKSLRSLLSVLNAAAATGIEDVKLIVPVVENGRLNGGSLTKAEKCVCAATVWVANPELSPLAFVKKKSTVASSSLGFAMDTTERVTESTSTNKRPNRVSAGAGIATSLTVTSFCLNERTSTPVGEPPFGTSAVA